MWGRRLPKRNTLELYICLSNHLSISTLATPVSLFLPFHIQPRCFSTQSTVTIATELLATVDFCSIWLQLLSCSQFHTCDTPYPVCARVWERESVRFSCCSALQSHDGHDLWSPLTDLPVVSACRCFHYCCLSRRHVSAGSTMSREPSADHRALVTLIAAST